MADKAIRGADVDVLAEIFYPDGTPMYRLVQSQGKSKAMAVQYYGIMNNRWVNTIAYGDIKSQWGKLVERNDRINQILKGTDNVY